MHISLYTYCRGWGNRVKKSLRLLSTSESGAPGNYQVRFYFCKLLICPWYGYSSQETGVRLVSAAFLQWRGKWSQALSFEEQRGKGHHWCCHTPFYFFTGDQRGRILQEQKSAFIYLRTKIIFCSEKQCISNIKRKQGPLIISISARTLDSIHGRSRDFSGAKEIFPWLPVHPVMGKGEGGISSVQFSDVHLQGEDS